MRLAIDGYSLTYNKSWGLYTYAKNVLDSISINPLLKNEHIDIDIYVPDEKGLVEPLQRKNFMNDLDPKLAVFIKKVPLNSFWVFIHKSVYQLHKWLPGGLDDVYKIYLFIWVRFILPSALKGKKDSDALLFLAQYAYSLPSSIKKVAVIHDVMTWYKFRGESKQNFIKSYIYNFFLKQIRKFDLLISISLATKADLVVEFGFTPDKIEVIYENIFPEYINFFNKREQKIDHEKNSEILQLYSLKKPYILVNNPFNERKNSIAMLAALPILQDKGIDLVFIGDANREREVKIKTKILSLIKNPESVKFLTIKDSAHLPYLYSNAEMFAVLSLKEGFGLPPLEALASGTLLIASELSTHLELLRNYKISFVDPFSPKAISKAVEDFVSLSKPERTDIINHNDRQLKMFIEKNSWENISTNILSSVMQLLK